MLAFFVHPVSVHVRGGSPFWELLAREKRGDAPPSWLEGKMYGDALGIQIIEAAVVLEEGRFRDEAPSSGFHQGQQR